MIFPTTIPIGLDIPVIDVAKALWFVGNQNSATFVGVNNTKGWAQPAIACPMIAIINCDRIERENRFTKKSALLRALRPIPKVVRIAPQ